MTNDISENIGANIIVDYVRKNCFWKELYFDHFSTKHKALFFLPIILLFSPIYGTYKLFYHDSWILFIAYGSAMLGAIYWFFKQKTYFEQKVFTRLYRTDHCNSVKEHHMQRLVTLLEAQNTPENRATWKIYFKQKPSTSIIIIFTTVLLSSSSYHVLKNDNLFLYNVVLFSFVILIMIFALVGPAFAGFKTKRAAYNEAYKLVEELDKR